MLERAARRSGQVTLEYFILFAVVAAATVIGFTTMGRSVRNSLEGFVSSVASAIAR